MSDLLQGKTAMVTGACGGIGKATCELLSENGAKIVAVDNNQEKGNALVKDIIDSGGECIFIKADVSNPDDCKDAVKYACEAFGLIDVLFNNAGITKRADVINTSIEEWNNVISVNLNAVFYMCKFVIPVMSKNGGGKIVNNASGWGLVGGANAVSYCASKGGVVLLTKAMALDHGKDNITVNCVCPGDTETGMLIEEARQLGLADNKLIEEGHLRPLGRIGTAREIASAVLFLSSQMSSFMTGSSLVVDGGGLAGSA